MPTRKTVFSPEEFYHIYNRGMRKQKIFLDDRDRARFLFLILFNQSPNTTKNTSVAITHYMQHRMFNVSEHKLAKILKHRMIELISFILMPNHFHLIVKEVEENGISRYMQKVLNAFTKYSNTKYKESGHLFQGPFQAVHIKNNDQLLYTSAYIHRNCRELNRWKKREISYSWSSYQDYVTENRWGELLKRDVVLDQFKDGDDYRKWVKESAAKELEIKEFN